MFGGRRPENRTRAPRRRRILRVPSPGTRQSLVALALNSLTSFAAGACLSAITGTLRDLPGLLVLVPAAIGLRGNVFSALGSRLSTTVHLGTFRVSARRDSVFGQNVAASLVLTLGISLVAALGASVLVLTLGISDRPAVGDLVLVSILGGTIASVVVLAATVGLSVAATRFGWDLDNLVAPIVSTLADVLTIPALWVASLLVGIPVVSRSLTLALVAAAVVLSVLAWRTPLDTLRRIVRESGPVLTAAVGFSMLAGLALEKQLELFESVAALLILQPAFVSSAGALGGILSSRLSTSFQLGLIEPDLVPDRRAREAGLVVATLAVPVALFNAAGAHLVAVALGVRTPGLLPLLGVSVLAGAVVVAFVLAVAYYGTMAATRVGLDPDTHGIPIVTSTVDFVGAVALIVAVITLGVG